MARFLMKQSKAVPLSRSYYFSYFIVLFSSQQTAACLMANAFSCPGVSKKFTKMPFCNLDADLICHGAHIWALASVFLPSGCIKSQADIFSFTCNIWSDLGNGLIYLGRFKTEKQAIETDLLVSAIDQCLEWKLIMSRRNVSDTSFPTELLKRRPMNTEVGTMLPLPERGDREKWFKVW